MVEGTFHRGNSSLHILDPRVKIIVAILFSIVVALAKNWEVVGGGFFFSASLLFLARLKGREIRGRLLVINGFILLLWIILPFTTPGEPLIQAGRLAITREGIDQSLLITIKCNTIVLATLALLSTSPIFSLVHGLSHLHFPRKMVHLFFFTYRYIHVLYREHLKLKNVLKTRGFKPGTNFHTYKTYGYLVATLLLKSYNRSERIYRAMLCRGFKGKYWMLDHFQLKGRDLAIGGLMLTYILGLGFLEWIKPIL